MMNTGEDVSEHLLNDITGEKLRKRIKTEESSVKETLKNIYEQIVSRINGLDKKIENVITHCNVLEEKVNLATGSLFPNAISSATATPNSYLGNLSASNLLKNLESDFPNGSWLGNENDPQHRVRCQITSEDLAIIDRSCNTPEKLALTLLDFLFDRETQACSNISGQGRHGKKQLDPLIIYGIKCHLIHRFNITESDWHKIRLNMDSKCRTAFRRKLKGLPLTVKAFRGVELVSDSNEKAVAKSVKTSKASVFSSAPSTSTAIPTPVFVVEGCVKSDNDQNLANQPSIEETFLTLDDNNAFPLELGFEIDPNSQVIQGEIQVLHATPEQLAEIQKSGKIQIITSNHLLNDNIKLQTASWDNLIGDNFIMSEHQNESNT
ncbi:hypothetical protein CHUAL_007150 [Chamberlinius hualienensis]